MSPVQANERLDVEDVSGASSRDETPKGTVVESTMRTARLRERKTAFIVFTNRLWVRSRGISLSLCLSEE
tara:strand:- start:357 stop:566 length:210 start_codon:yes stop_codon:yes gene_type:complete